MGTESQKIKVSFLHRKPRSVGNYSLEFIFKDIRERLSSKIEAKVIYSKYESNGFFKRLYNIFEAKQNQSTVTHVTGDVNYLGCLLKKKTTIHTILDCIHLKSSTGIKHKVLKYFWLTLPVKRSTYITAISTSTKNEILKYVNCNSDKIIVIPVAISNRFKRVDKSFNKAKPTVLQLGTAPNKNIERLIDALQNIHCKLVIIGAKHVHIENLLIARKIDYEYLQGLNDDDIKEQYEKADIITLISTYEGFGMPILEAQAVGRVVITANLFSMPEVGSNAVHYADAFSVQSITESFLKVIEDDQYRDGLIKKGFDNVKRFDPDLIANQYYELYKKIADRN
jgi:glycosyltransferase involved in cell wall biosynthesis